jgi:hypothetical protein
VDSRFHVCFNKHTTPILAGHHDIETQQPNDFRHRLLGLPKLASIKNECQQIIAALSMPLIDFLYTIPAVIVPFFSK